MSYEGRPKYTLYNDDPEIDPNHLFTKADWDALSPETKKARKRTAAYYLEPDQLKFSVELELSDGTITPPVKVRRMLAPFFVTTNEFPCLVMWSLLKRIL